MSKPKMSELLRAAGAAADPYSQANMQAQGNSFEQSGVVYDSGQWANERQMSRILYALARVFQAHEDAPE